MKSIQMKSITWIEAGMFYVILMLMTYFKKKIKKHVFQVLVHFMNLC